MTRRLAEVAKYVGVSEATVSRVLNGRPGISHATRTAVLTALDVLGYERPVKLRGERARLVGLVLPELQNPIFPAFAEVVAGALAKKGFTPVLCTRTTDGVAESDYVDMLLDQHVSGVIFAGGNYAQADADHGHYRRLVQRGLPAVLVNASIEGLEFPRVSADDAVAVRQAYGHLTSLGHKRIGLILGPRDHVPSQRKAAAFAALAEAQRVNAARIDAGSADVSPAEAARTGRQDALPDAEALIGGAVRAQKPRGRIAGSPSPAASSASLPAATAVPAAGQADVSASVPAAARVATSAAGPSDMSAAVATGSAAPPTDAFSAPHHLCSGRSKDDAGLAKTSAGGRQACSCAPASRQASADLVEHTFFSMEGGHAAAARLLERGVTALICASDVLALGAVRGVRRAGLRVPTEVSIVGYDDSAVMTCTDPPLTTVRQPIEAMGQAAVQLLIAEIAGRRVVADELLFEPELVVRGSTASAY